jgi:hypothetical protein
MRSQRAINSFSKGIDRDTHLLISIQNILIMMH